MKRYAPWVMLLAIALIAFDPPAISRLSAQTSITLKGEAQNVRFELRDEGIVHIFYDLISSDPRAVFTVLLEASQDGGTTFGMKPQQVTGDVGEKVTPGTEKRIEWDSGKDVERVRIDRFRFRIVATGAPLQTQSGTSTSKLAPPTTATQTASPGSTEAKKGRGPLLWGGIGAGALAVGGVAIAAGGGGGGNNNNNNINQPPAQTNSQPVVTQASVSDAGTLLATATSVRFTVTATDADSDTLTALWDFGDSTTFTGAFSGGASTADKVYNNASTFTPRVTVTDGRGGSVSATLSPVTVGALTGGWRGEFADPTYFPQLMNINQNGSNLNGGSVARDTPFSISGTVSGPRRATIRFTNTFGNYFEYAVTGSSDLRTFTGTDNGGVLPPLTMTRQ